MAEHIYEGSTRNIKLVVDGNQLSIYVDTDGNNSFNDDGDIIAVFDQPSLGGEPPSYVQCSQSFLGNFALKKLDDHTIKNNILAIRDAVKKGSKSESQAVDEIANMIVPYCSKTRANSR